MPTFFSPIQNCHIESVDTVPITGSLRRDDGKSEIDAVIACRGLFGGYLLTYRDTLQRPIADVIGTGGPGQDGDAVDTAFRERGG